MKEETAITFLAAECGEFHGMGECIECTSLKKPSGITRDFANVPLRCFRLWNFPCTMQRILCITRENIHWLPGEGKKVTILCSLLCQSSAGAGSGKGIGTAGESAEEIKKAGKGTLESTEDGRCVIERYQRKSAGSKSKDPQSCLPASERTGAFCDAGDKRKDQHHGR